MTSIRYMIVLNTVQFNLGFTIHNLVYRNYHFLALDDIIKRELEEPKPFIVKGIRYDSQTGLPLDDTKHLSKVA